MKISSNKTDLAFLFDIKSPCTTKEYTKNEKDFAEVDFILGPYASDSYRVKLVNNGAAVSLEAATPKFFGEYKRIKKQMGDKYCKNDPRAIAHSKIVQTVRTTKKAVDGKFWGAPQVVKLPFQCKGVINKSWNYHPNGNTVGRNVQYALILTVRIKAAKVMVEKEKSGKINICDDISADSDDSDIDDDNDDAVEAGNDRDNNGMDDNEFG